MRSSAEAQPESLMSLRDEEVRTVKKDTQHGDCNGLSPKALRGAGLPDSLPPHERRLRCRLPGARFDSDAYRVRVLVLQSCVATDAGELGPLYPPQQPIVCRVQDLRSARNTVRDAPARPRIP